MFEISFQLLIGWFILTSFMFVMALLFNGISLLRGFFWRGLTGISTILIGNCIFHNLNIQLGINIFTAFVSGCLGIPGVAMMYCLQYFII